MINQTRLSIRKAFTAASMLFSYVSRKVYRSAQEKEVERWYRAAGDKTLRVDYHLDINSVVYDLCGYEGDWAAEIAARYRSKIFIFEPVPDYVSRLTKRFSHNPSIEVFPFGLGSVDSKQVIHIAEEGSSIFNSPNVPKRNSEIPITIKCAAEFISKLNPQVIDLMKINIEGGEYDLLEHLIDTGLISRIYNLQVQFHNFVPQAEERMNRIHNRLKLSHSLTYQYRFVWENWKIKGGVV